MIASKSFISIDFMVIELCYFMLELAGLWVGVLIALGCKVAPCRGLSMFGQVISKKRNRSRFISAFRVWSKCLLLFGYSVRRGSTAYGGGYPPSKAQPQRGGGQHYVAPKKQGDFGFWVWVPTL